MNEYLKKIKRWYSFRLLREKLLFIGMCWAFIYAVFSFIIFMPLENKRTQFLTEIKTAENEITNWKMQISALNRIPDSPLYKKWQAEHQSFDTKTKAYRSLLQASTAINWEEIVKYILHSDHTIVIEQIKNFPEELYNPPDFKIPIPLYQQRLLLVVQSNYFDTIAYLKRLQASLPTIHWQKMTYHVEQYPVAKVQLEFLVLYEKTS